MAGALSDLKGEFRCVDSATQIALIVHDRQFLPWSQAETAECAPMMKPAASRVIFSMTPLRKHGQQSAACKVLFSWGWQVLRSFGSRFGMTVITH
jgi:hypothetical protein